MTQPLYLLHVPVDSRALAEWIGGQVSHYRQFTPDNGLALHKLLSGLFGKGVVQPFRLFTPSVGSWSLYGYSAQNAESLRETAKEVAMPEMEPLLQLDKLRSKEMPASFPVGKRLGFDVLVRPTRRKSHEDPETKKSTVREGDAYTFAYDKAKKEDQPIPLRNDVYEAWLKEKLAPAAEVEIARLVSMAQTRICRNGKFLDGAEAVFQGTLKVTDSDAFREGLQKGIGRHRAYGYGMILLRPADPLSTNTEA